MQIRPCGNIPPTSAGKSGLSTDQFSLAGPCLLASPSPFLFFTFRRSASPSACPAFSLSHRIASPPPNALSAGGQQKCAGEYALVDGETANGHPLWKQVAGSFWLYSGVNGMWIIGGPEIKEKNFDCSFGSLFCKVLHGGTDPNKVPQCVCPTLLRLAALLPLQFLRPPLTAVVESGRHEMVCPVCWFRQYFRILRHSCSHRPSWLCYVQVRLAGRMYIECIQSSDVRAAKTAEDVRGAHKYRCCSRGSPTKACMALASM